MDTDISSPTSAFLGRNGFFDCFQSKIPLDSPPVIRLFYPWLLLLSLIAPLIATETKSPLDESAEEATYFLFNESMTRLQNAEKKGQLPPRETNYLKGILFLNIQPKTESNLDQAVHLLESVRSANPEDDLGIASLYFIGRIAQIHRSQPDYAKSESIFQELTQKYPTHVLAQQAMVKLTTQRIYTAKNRDELAIRLHEAEKFSPLITSRAASTSYHTIMADAYLRFTKETSQAMRHFQLADASGITNQQQRSNTLVQIAEIARTLNQPSVAISYYEKFLLEFPRDRRTFMIKESLADLKKGPLKP